MKTRAFGSKDEAQGDASPAPLVLYDIPARTGVRIELDTLLAPMTTASPALLALVEGSGTGQPD